MAKFQGHDGLILQGHGVGRENFPSNVYNKGEVLKSIYWGEFTITIKAAMQI
jgi:hypothetical protein